MSGFGIDFRRLSGRPRRWDMMTWLLSEIDRRRLPHSRASARDLLWEVRRAAQDDENRRRLAAYRARRAAAGLS
jgi:hypothetical protein